MKAKTMHAHERLIVEGQKSVTTLCGRRVIVGGPLRSVIITRNEHAYPARSRAYNCVGCIAIIEERGK